MSVYVPFASVEVSSVHAAGLVGDVARTRLFSRNSIRVGEPVAVAVNVTSPVKGLVPLTVPTVITGPATVPAA